MGVAGCGKSTIGRELAQVLDLEYIEGDDFHLDSSVKKMAAGQGLADSDRFPWLVNLNQIMRESDVSLVISCSALKHRYRQILSENVDVKFVYLNISPALALQRVSSREHFFPTSLVESQFETLEVPEGPSVIWCDAAAAIEEVVLSARAALADATFSRSNRSS